MACETRRRSAKGRSGDAAGVSPTWLSAWEDVSVTSLTTPSWWPQQQLYSCDRGALQRRHGARRHPTAVRCRSLDWPPGRAIRAVRAVRGEPGLPCRPQAPKTYQPKAVTWRDDRWPGCTSVGREGPQDPHPIENFPLVSVRRCPALSGPATNRSSKGSRPAWTWRPMSLATSATRPHPEYGVRLSDGWSPQRGCRDKGRHVPRAHTRGSGR